MKEFLEILVANINVLDVVLAIFTFIIVPIGKQFYEYMKTKKLNGYVEILYNEVANAVKATYQESVTVIKKNNEWNDTTKRAVKDIARSKTIKALSNSVHKALSKSNVEFDDWLDSLIEKSVYELKNENKTNKTKDE